MNPKQGLNKSGNSANMSKWTIPQPSGYKPENAPAKPQGGQHAPAGMASKTANTHSGVGGMVSSIKSRF